MDTSPTANSVPDSPPTARNSRDTEYEAMLAVLTDIVLMSDVVDEIPCACYEAAPCAAHQLEIAFRQAMAIVGPILRARRAAAPPSDAPAEEVQR